MLLTTSQRNMAVRSGYLFAEVIVSYFCQDLVEGLLTGCCCVPMPGKVNSGRESGNTLPALSSAPFVCLSTGGGTEPLSHRLRLRDSARSGHTWGFSSEARVNSHPSSVWWLRRSHLGESTQAHVIWRLIWFDLMWFPFNTKVSPTSAAGRSCRGPTYLFKDKVINVGRLRTVGYGGNEVSVCRYLKTKLLTQTKKCLLWILNIPVQFGKGISQCLVFWFCRFLSSFKV